jgi:hypothetical protein
MPKCIIGPNGVAHGPMCQDGRLCGRRGNRLESDRKPQPTLTDEEREAIEESIQFAFPASHPTATTLRNLLQRTK